MVKIISTFILLVLFTYECLAGNINLKNRVSNDRKFAVCWFACADTYGREYNIPNLIGFRDKALHSDDKNGADLLIMEKWLNNHDIKSEYVWFYSFTSLEKYIKTGYTPIISIKAKYPVGLITEHSVILLDIFEEDGQKKVRYMDPNDIQNDYIGTWEWFKQNWRGMGQILHAK